MQTPYTVSLSFSEINRTDAYELRAMYCIDAVARLGIVPWCQQISMVGSVVLCLASHSERVESYRSYKILFNNRWHLTLLGYE